MKPNYLTGTIILAFIVADGVLAYFKISPPPLVVTGSALVCGMLPQFLAGKPAS